MNVGRALQAAAVVVVLGASLACGSEPPRVDRVSPVVGVEGERTELTIHGGGFFFRYDAFGHRLDSELRAFVGANRLEELEWLDAATLVGVVPETVAAGTYDVVVESAGGRGLQVAGFVVQSAP